MADKIESYKLVCAGGLNSNENHLDLSDNEPGSATRLVNYEPSLFGGYRRIEGFELYDDDYGEVDDVNNTGSAQGKVLAVAIFRDDVSELTKILAARADANFVYTATASQTAFSGSDDNSRSMVLNNGSNITVTKNGTKLALTTDYTVSGNTVTLVTAASADDEIVINPQEYSFYHYTALIGWRPYTLDHSVTRPMVTGGRTVTKLRHAQFNFGDGNKICFVDGVNPAIVFDGSHWEQLTSSGAGTSPADSGHNSETGGGDQCLDAPALVDVFENHLFLAGDQTELATVAHSAPNDAYDFTVANGAGQIFGGFDVVQIKPFRDNLFVFGENGIRKIVADVSSGFVIDQVTANVGCVARDSVLEIGGDLMFLAPDGFRPVAGTSRIGDVELETVSKPIQATLVDFIKNNDMDTLNGVVIRSKSQVRYFVGNDDKDVGDSIGIIGGLSQSTGSIKWEFGELLGIRASCTASEYVNNEELVLHGDYDGKVYRQERGVSFNDEDIVASYATPYLDFGDTDVRKMVRKVNTFIRAEGPLELNLALAFDWGDYNTARPSTYSQESQGGPTVYAGRGITYNGANTIYGGSSKPIMTSDVQGSGFSVRATYVTFGQFEPYSIQGIVFEFSTSGRR